MADNKKTDKKPKFFVRIWKRTNKFFREMRAELKKVVWPSFKQVVNNTGVVIATVLVVGAIISLFSVAATQGVSLLVGLGR